MYYYVYKITNLINNKIYVGKHKSSVHPLENGYYGSGKQILAAIKKYGKENFSKVAAEKNGQYGKYWITNIVTKETKRLNKNEIIPEGWVRGKTGHVPKKVWVNNNITEHFILTSKYEQYIIAGYLKGRLKRKQTA